MSIASEIHQLVHTLSYGDAISSEVLAVQRAFIRRGSQSKIYAINVHPKYKGLAHDYREFPGSFCGEVVLHYSLGSPLNDLYLGLPRATRAIIHHNLTPARWFSAVNPRIAADIKRGIAELPKLCRASDRIIADSSFNAQELASQGLSVAVLPLLVDPERWAVDANFGIAQLLNSSGGINVVHVGRYAPNKCLEDLIRIFYFLHHHVEKNSRLWLSGIDIDTELYSYELKRLARELNVDHAVNFTGCMADSELRALYANAGAYLCMSEHEGFCLPLLEAMHFGLPVIAYAAGAVPETVGNGGIIVREKRHAQIAELVAEVSRNTALRQALIAAGKKRAAEFSLEKFEARLGEVFGGLAAPPLTNAAVL